jgi:hypothetical protein
VGFVISGSDKAMRRIQRIVHELMGFKNRGKVGKAKRKVVVMSFQ